MASKTIINHLRLIYTNHVKAGTISTRAPCKVTIKALLNKGNVIISGEKSIF